MPVDSGAVVREARVDTLDRLRHETSAAVDALAELRDRDPALDLVDMAVLHVRHEQPRGVRTEIDDADAGHRLGTARRARRTRRRTSSNAQRSTKSRSREA